MSSSKVASTVVVVERKGKDKEPPRESELQKEERKRKIMDPSATKAGGAYIPPAKLRMMQQQIEDKNSEQYQRLSWELLKKRILGQVNRANVENIDKVVFALLQENIVRGKGLLARSILQAQAFSPAFSNVYAAMVAIINSKFPHIGELILKRLIIQFKRSFKNNDKAVAITASKFLAHLINQNVAHEVLALELLHLLLESPTDDSIEVAIAFLKECGAKLTEVSPRGVDGIFNRLRSILHESEIDKRVQYAIEVAFHVRRDKFVAYPTIEKGLDLVQEADEITHTLSLDDEMSPENMLNVFRYDPDFVKNEEMYQEIKEEMLSQDSSDEEGEGNSDEEGETPAGGQDTTIVDNTEINVVAFRRTVYLTIQSSLDFQEAVHKIQKMDVKPGMEVELCHMILDCCAQQRTYEKFYGLMAERFCRLRKEYQGHFEQIFKDTYDTIHRFEITKLRNTARLFAHLLYTDAISWNVLGHIKLNEDDTTSASRIFIKILFQELAEFMGMDKLYERTQDPTMQQAFEGVLPRDNPRDTRFSTNFFTSIGLGGLTVDLREHLKSGPKQPVVSFPQAPGQNVKEEPREKVVDVTDSTSSSDSDSSTSSDKSRERHRKRSRKTTKKHQKKATKERRR